MPESGAAYESTRTRAGSGRVVGSADHMKRHTAHRNVTTLGVWMAIPAHSDSQPGAGHGTGTSREIGVRRSAGTCEVSAG